MSQSLPLDAAAQGSLTAARPRATPLSRRSVIAVGTGNALEFYDFAVFASLTPVISQLFFPSSNALAAILSTFVVYAVGFLMRPLGAIIFGRLGDRSGRKVTMIVVVTIMGFSTVLMGLLPTFTQIGAFAPVLLVVARMLQGLSVGGEFGTSATYLLEYAPDNRRGIYGAFAFFSSTAGSVIGVFVVFLLTLLMSATTISDWGWRIPFLLGFPLLLLGFYLRYRVSESPEFEEIKADKEREKSPVLTVFKEHWRAILIVIGVVCGFATASATVQAFMPSYVKTVVGLPANQSLGAVLIATTVAIFMVLAFGALSDRFGGRRILILASVLTILLPYPSLVVVGLGGFGAAVAGLLILWVPVAAFGGAAPAMWADMFPTAVRVSGFGIAYGFGTAIFAGSAPFVSTWLIQTSGNPLAPAWYMIVGGIVTAIVVIAAVGRKPRARSAGSSSL
ncbi:MFS transporter [Subtercola lobariae]|uniref:Putative proline/betaine transporter n=1 Tax=Subtercola lobariae TaxID=1588641 RepID=A0A917BFJ0_9MICO|nr:MFS transporter [Subtercola lobariae]GGF41616.1 proline/betaine transporter [Subtercola lobariae]